MNRFRTALSVTALALAVGLAGCASAGTAGTGTSITGTTSAGSSSSTTSGTAQAAVSLDTLAADTHYDADDLTWDAAAEVAVTLADGASTVASGTSSDAVKVDGDTVTISAAGTYRLSGSLSDGQVVVAAGEEDVVRIILDGAEISSSTGSPFVVQSANEAIVYLEDGTSNSLSDASTYADTAEDAPNAALYSQADLTIAGTGSLTVDGNFNDGISSKDGLVLAAGTVTVDAADDGIVGKDYAVLLDGAYQVTAGDDGFKSDNEEDEGRGWVLINGGTLTVSAGDDGIKAFNTLTIAAGVTTVERIRGRPGGPAHRDLRRHGQRHRQRRRRERLGRVLHLGRRPGRDGRGRRRDGRGRLHGGGHRRLADHQRAGRRPGLQRQRHHLRRHRRGQRPHQLRQRRPGRQRRTARQRRHRGRGRKRRHGGGAGHLLDAVRRAGHPRISVPAGTVVQIADSAGTVVSAFVTTKATASLVFSSPRSPRARSTRSTPAAPPPSAPGWATAPSTARPRWAPSPPASTPQPRAPAAEAGFGARP